MWHFLRQYIFFTLILVLLKKKKEKNTMEYEINNGYITNNATSTSLKYI